MVPMQAKGRLFQALWGLSSAGWHKVAACELVVCRLTQTGAVRERGTGWRYDDQQHVWVYQVVGLPLGQFTGSLGGAIRWVGQCMAHGGADARADDNLGVAAALGLLEGV